MSGFSHSKSYRKGKLADPSLKRGIWPVIRKATYAFSSRAPFYLEGSCERLEASYPVFAFVYPTFPSMASDWLGQK
jgi:hypothetical protein